MIGGVGWNGRRPVYPQTGALFTGQTGLVASSLYLFNEAAGSVLDKVGVADLAVVNAPVFDYRSRGQQGIAYDTLNDAHRANVNSMALASGIYAAVFSSFSAVDVTKHIWGYGDSADTSRLRIQYQGGDTTIGAQIQSGASNLVLSVIPPPEGDDIPRIVLLQIDRAAAVARLRLAGSGEVPLVAAGSIVGFGTFTGTGVTAFGAGQVIAGTGLGCAVFYGMFLSGVQCEGATVLQDLSRHLGWE